MKSRVNFLRLTWPRSLFRAFVIWLVAVGALLVLPGILVNPRWPSQAITAFVIGVLIFLALITIIFGYVFGKHFSWRYLLRIVSCATVIALLFIDVDISLWVPNQPTTDNSTAIALMILLIPIVAFFSTLLGIGAYCGRLRIALGNKQKSALR